MQENIEEISDDEIRKETERYTYTNVGGPNRYVCDVLDEMRKCSTTGNYSYLPGLIEELQVMVNRMEAKLNDKHDYYSLRKRLLDKVIEDKAQEDLEKKGNNVVR